MGHHGAQRSFLERRADQHRLATARKQQGHQAFGGAPGNPGEIAKRIAGADQQRIGADVVEECPRVLDANEVFLAGDGRGDGVPWGQGRTRVRR